MTLANVQRFFGLALFVCARVLGENPNIEALKGSVPTASSHTKAAFRFHLATLALIHIPYFSLFSSQAEVMPAIVAWDKTNRAVAPRGRPRSTGEIRICV